MSAITKYGRPDSVAPASNVEQNNRRKPMIIPYNNALFDTEKANNELIFGVPPVGPLGLTLGRE
jgi:hypothetical protein